MDDRVKVFMSDGRKHLKTHAMKFQLSWRYVVSATVDCDLMTAGDEPSREMLCESLEAPVTGWYTPGSQNSYAHLLGFIFPVLNCKHGSTR